MRKLKLMNQRKKELLNVNEAALKLGVSPKTVRKWQHAGRLPYVKYFGGVVRFQTETLEQLINQSVVQRSV